MINRKEQMEKKETGKLREVQGKAARENRTKKGIKRETEEDKTRNKKNGSRKRETFRSKNREKGKLGREIRIIETEKKIGKPGKG